MKKIVIMILIFLFALQGCTKENTIDYVSKEIGIDISSGKIEKEIDNHGGMGNDGTLFVKINVTDKSLEDKIKKSNKWKSSKYMLIDALLYGTEENNCGYGPFIVDENNKPFLKKIKNAYYYIEDRNNTGCDLTKLDLLNEYSLNVSLAVYDIDTSTLYYFEEDT